MLCPHEGGESIGEYLLLYFTTKALYTFVLVEGGLEGIVDTLIHPPLSLTLTLLREVARVHSEVSVFVDHIPDLLNPNAIEARVGKYLGTPARLCGGEEM